MTDILQTVTFLVLGITLILGLGKGCEYEHQEKMERIKLSCPVKIQ